MYLSNVKVHLDDILSQSSVCFFVFLVKLEDVDLVSCQRGGCSCESVHGGEEATETMLCLSRDKESQGCLVSTWSATLIHLPCFQVENMLLISSCLFPPASLKRERNNAQA